VFGLNEAKLYLEAPVVIDATLRGNLDAFKDRDPVKHWAWFVLEMTTSRITESPMIRQPFVGMTPQPAN
jgi:hypothetical protein